MNVSVTCRICGEEFQGESFDDVEDDLEAHVDRHAEAIEAGADDEDVQEAIEGIEG